MDTLLFILLGAILVVLILMLIAMRKFLTGRDQSAGDQKPVDRGIIAERQDVRDRRLNEIMRLFEKYETLTNMIVRHELEYDERSIVNYMDGLEKQGRVIQIGKTGIHAHYKKVT